MSDMTLTHQPACGSCTGRNAWRGDLQVCVHEFSRVVRTVDTSNEKLAINLITKGSKKHRQVPRKHPKTRQTPKKIQGICCLGKVHVTFEDLETSALIIYTIATLATSRLEVIPLHNN